MRRDCGRAAEDWSGGPAAQQAKREGDRSAGGESSGERTLGCQRLGGYPVRVSTLSNNPHGHPRPTSTVKPPRSRSRRPAITHNAVPVDENRVSWLLLTTLSIETIEEVLQVVDDRVARWSIETRRPESWPQSRRTFSSRRAHHPSPPQLRAETPRKSVIARRTSSRPGRSSLGLKATRADRNPLDFSVRSVSSVIHTLRFDSRSFVRFLISFKNLYGSTFSFCSKASNFCCSSGGLCRR